MKRIVLIVFFLLLMIITGSTAIAGPGNDSGNDFETARKYYYSGRYNEAVRHLRDYIAQKPDAAAYYMMGYALYKLKRFDEANENFRDAYLLNPMFSPVKNAGSGDQPKKAMKARAKVRREVKKKIPVRRG
ncbi:MAG: tetratricopeptide repeat protein [Thermodesulfovibrionales bacterium]